MTAAALLAALEDAGGAAAPRERTAQLRTRLAAELLRGQAELARPRSGYGDPVVVAFAAAAGGIAAAVPVDAAVRADPGKATERAFRVAAAAVGALVAATGAPPVAATAGLTLLAGTFEGSLAIVLPAAARDADPGLAALACEEQAAPVDRLRAVAVAVPGAVLDGLADVRVPPAPDLRVAEAAARFGARPADEASMAAHEEALAALFAGPGGAVARPHDDPDPRRRVARRILQRLAGMGKWGGYHTDVAHLGRGFEGNDRALASEVGEALVAAGLLSEKTSVGQRHVFLNPRRAADIHALIDRAEVPAGLAL